MQQYRSSYYQLIAIEDSGFYNSLYPGNACPNSAPDSPTGALGFQAFNNWTQIYLKETVPRLQQNIHGVQLDVLSVFAMQQLCAYETVALGYSVFCDLFTEEEWEGFEYANGKPLEN